MGSDDDGTDEERERKRRKHSSKHKKHKHRSKKDHKEKREKDHKEKKRRKKRRRSSSSSSDSSSEPARKRGRSASSPQRSASSSPGIGPALPPPPAALSVLPPAEQPSARPFSSLTRVPAKDSGGGGLAGYLRCAPCGVDSSGEAAFLQHLCGKAHRKANNGCPGFAGLVPNAVGRIPPLINPALRSAAMRLGQNPDGTAAAAGDAPGDLPPPPWRPPCRTVLVR